MNALLRFDPFRDLERFATGFSAQHKAWTPPVDIEEDEKEYLFKVELPDVEKDGIKVKVDDGVLAISGERKAAQSEKESKKKYHRIERTFGSFQRSFVLPDDSDPSLIRAEFKNGILVVYLPKNEKAQPKLIDVKVN